MKASEIVDKLKSVLLSADEEPQVETAEEQVELAAEEVEVNEPVELGYEDKEGMEEEMPEEEVKIEYVSKDDFEKAIAEIKAMVEALAQESMSEDMEVEVPVEELSKEEEPQKEELSSQEPGAEPISHSPEVEEGAKHHAFAGNKPRNTMSVVYEKMFNK
jgi:hypothetical protein